MKKVEFAAFLDFVKMVNPTLTPYCAEVFFSNYLDYSDWYELPFVIVERTGLSFSTILDLNIAYEYLLASLDITDSQSAIECALYTKYDQRCLEKIGAADFNWQQHSNPEFIYREIADREKVKAVLGEVLEADALGRRELTSNSLVDYLRHFCILHTMITNIAGNAYIDEKC